MASSADGKDAPWPNPMSARLANRMSLTLLAAEKLTHAEREVVAAVAESVAEPDDPVTTLTMRIKAASCQDDFSVAKIQEIAEISWNEFQQAVPICM